MSLVFLIRRTVAAPLWNTKRMFLSSSRLPSIKFIGKRSPLPTSMFETPASGDKSIPDRGIYFGSLKDAALFGRPNISSAEIEAIESGGAAVAIN